MPFEDRALLVGHADGDAAERRGAGRGIGDGNRAAGRRTCAVPSRERIGVGDDGALAGVDGRGGRGGNEGRARRLVDEAAAEFVVRSPRTIVRVPGMTGSAITMASGPIALTALA